MKGAMTLLALLLVDHALAVVTIATANWHTFNLIGEVLKVEFEARDVDVESSATRYGSSGAAMEALLAGDVHVVPEAWVSIQKANGFYTLGGFVCGDASLCDNLPSCARPTSTDCAACEQACSGNQDCRMYACSATEVDDTQRCQLWSAPHSPKVGKTTDACTLKAGWIDFRALSTGIEGIYVPNSVSAPDWTSPEVLAASELTVLVGPPLPWASAHTTTAAIASKYNLQLITPKSSADHLMQIFDLMKRDTKFAFYFWKPHAIAATYNIMEVALPLNTDIAPPAPYFSWTNLLTVWRVDNHDVAKHVKKITSVRHLTHDEFNVVLAKVATHISFALPPTNPAYHKAITSAARDHLCRVGKQAKFCVPATQWPLERMPQFPNNVLVWTRDCVGFVKCVSDNGTLLDRPENGYTIDHLHNAMQLVGYQRQEYDIQCHHGSDGFAGMISKTGLELASFAHSCITITAERLMQVSFSTPFYHTGLGILVRRPEPEDAIVDQLAALSAPFESGTWIILMATLFVSSTVLLLAECTHNARKQAMLASMPFSLSSTTSVPPTPESVVKPPEDGDTRFLMVFNLVVLIIIAEFYTANLAALLVIDPTPNTIRGLQDLRGTSKKVATLNASAPLLWLASNEPGLNLEPCAGDLSCMNAVLDGSIDAFVYDEPILRYLAALDCELMLVNAPLFFIQDYGIVFPRGSPLRDTLSHAITFLREEGLHAELQSKYFRTRECKKNQEKSKIKPWSLVGLFSIFLAFAVVVYLYIAIKWVTQAIQPRKKSSKRTTGEIVDIDIPGVLVLDDHDGIGVLRLAVKEPKSQSKIVIAGDSGKALEPDDNEAFEAGAEPPIGQPWVQPGEEPVQPRQHDEDNANRDTKDEERHGGSNASPASTEQLVESSNVENSSPLTEREK
eukprot:GEMP01012948.1.p1 GENE.GEMP01012948.1~~GEMP01012948.1.p1  ORF type:complete len:916 (+),score=153.29 GEMP01012948.1:34-2748(+)